MLSDEEKYKLLERVKDSNKGNIDIIKDLKVDKKNLSWFIGRMFNPEDNIWVWIRRIANLLTLPSFIILIILLFR